jgi:hypothetical protein
MFGFIRIAVILGTSAVIAAAPSRIQSLQRRETAVAVVSAAVVVAAAVLQ